MTFRTRSFITALATAAITLAVAISMVSLSVRRTVTERIQRTLVNEARLAAETLSHRQAASPTELDAEADALASLLAVRVSFIAPDGTVVGDSERRSDELAALENHRDRPEVQQARQSGLGISRRYSATVHTDMLYVAVPVNNAAIPALAQVRLALPLTEERDQLAALGRTAVISAAAGLGSALLLAGITSVLLSRRVASITAVAERHAAADSSWRTHDYGNDEIGAVARVLDESMRETGRRATELATDRARMEAILIGMTEGVLALNGDGRVVLANAAARRLLRLVDEPHGRHYLEMVRHPTIAAQVAAALRGFPGEPIELSLQQGVTTILRSAPVQAPTASGAVVVLHDITELRRADRMRRDFVANVSHELRTPLTAVRGYVEALLEGDHDPGEARRFLEIIARHTLRMERLVRDLLRLARLDAGQEQLDRMLCSVETLFSGVEAELTTRIAERHLRVIRDIAPDAASVDGDPARLHDVVRNLLENAAHYSPEHGTIVMASRRKDHRTLLIVRDEGRGIPESDLPRVFERFYRVDKARSRGERDPGGTGLGLAIVKHLVELHGGSVTAANGPEGGAIFTIELP